jgi:hypothetical protein
LFHEKNFKITDVRASLIIAIIRVIAAVTDHA